MILKNSRVLKMIRILIEYFENDLIRNVIEIIIETENKC